ncbi:hypothetical protein GCM10009578_046370 [Streptomyces rhizosphaericus]
MDALGRPCLQGRVTHDLIRIAPSPARSTADRPLTGVADGYARPAFLGAEWKGKPNALAATPTGTPGPRIHTGGNGLERFPRDGPGTLCPLPHIFKERNAAFICFAPEPRGSWTTLTGGGRRMRDGAAGHVVGDRADMVGTGAGGGAPPGEPGIRAVSGRQGQRRYAGNGIGHLGLQRPGESGVRVHVGG